MVVVVLVVSAVVLGVVRRCSSDTAFELGRNTSYRGRKINIRGADIHPCNPPGNTNKEGSISEFKLNTVGPRYKGPQGTNQF